jgi:hypothetical protein
MTSKKVATKKGGSPGSEGNRYSRLIAHVFAAKHKPGVKMVEFVRAEIEKAAADLSIDLPKNLGDVVYSFRYRTDLPASISSRAPMGKHWIILPAGRSKYAFVATSEAEIVPNSQLSETKIPDATPGLIIKHAKDDEQALLAKLRYNRLIDVFTGITCYSLQSHFRTQVRGKGQSETDELYVGVDARGVQYVLPVQAKGGKDRLSPVQIIQDLDMCAQKFPGLLVRPIGAQFMADDLIAMFELERVRSEIKIARERHYRLVEPEGVTAEELAQYMNRTKD